MDTWGNVLGANPHAAAPQLAKPNSGAPSRFLRPPTTPFASCEGEMPDATRLGKHFTTFRPNIHNQATMQTPNARHCDACAPMRAIAMFEPQSGRCNQMLSLTGASFTAMATGPEAITDRRQSPSAWLRGQKRTRVNKMISTIFRQERPFLFDVSKLRPRFWTRLLAVQYS